MDEIRNVIDLYHGEPGQTIKFSQIIYEGVDANKIFYRHKFSIVEDFNRINDYRRQYNKPAMLRADYFAGHGIKKDQFNINLIKSWAEKMNDMKNVKDEYLDQYKFKRPKVNDLSEQESTNGQNESATSEPDDNSNEQQLTFHGPLESDTLEADDLSSVIYLLSSSSDPYEQESTNGQNESATSEPDDISNEQQLSIYGPLESDTSAADDLSIIYLSSSSDPYDVRASWGKCEKGDCGMQCFNDKALSTLDSLTRLRMIQLFNQPTEIADLSDFLSLESYEKFANVSDRQSIRELYVDAVVGHNAKFVIAPYDEKRFVNQKLEPTSSISLILHAFKFAVCGREEVTKFANGEFEQINIRSYKIYIKFHLASPVAIVIFDDSRLNDFGLLILGIVAFKDSSQYTCQIYQEVLKNFQSRFSRIRIFFKNNQKMFKSENFRKNGCGFRFEDEPENQLFMNLDVFYSFFPSYYNPADFTFGFWEKP